VCEFEILAKNNNEDYEVQYERLMDARDFSSSTEKRFLEFLYKYGYKLPDEAQKKDDDIYCQPDFYYTDEKVHVFCDGTPHDKPEIKDKDKWQRKALRDKGERVWVYYYKDALEDIVARRPDIFKKVR